MKNFILSLLLFVLIMNFVSCIEHTEEIFVTEDGTATIKTSYEGNASQIEGIALPYEPVWSVTKNNGSKSSDMELRAELKVAYGDEFPVNYAKPYDETKDLQLQFPTEVKFWTVGNRTYYEFTRTYQPRKFKCYDLPSFLSDHDLWDQDLESRVLEKGIFNVSEADRDEYLDQITYSYAYLQWRLHWETISKMYAEELISLTQKAGLEKQAADYLEQELTHEKILGILGKEEDSIGIELDRLTKLIHEKFYADFVKATGNGKTKLHHQYSKIFHRIKIDFEITKKLDSHSFALAVQLPGTIIKTNGYIEYEKPDVVEWSFEGDELHDKNIPLYALSVVEK